MHYWTVEKYRNGVKYFIKGTDQAGYPIETTNEDEAWRFNDLNMAMSFFDMGYSIVKHY